jgi:hypothetical protein
MDALPFETPEFTALLDDAEVWLDTWVAQYRAAFVACFGQSIEAQYAAAANSLLMAGVRAVAGYQAQPRRASAVRAHAYTRGAVKAPRRETRAQRIARECRALGLQGAA